MKEAKPIQKRALTRIEPEGEDPLPSPPAGQQELNIESEEIADEMKKKEGEQQQQAGPGTPRSPQ